MNKITMAVAGDCIITMKMSVHSEPRFIGLMELFRSADAAFVNLETLFHDYETDAYPSAEPGGSFCRSDPALTQDLKWMGFDGVSTANNHSLDYMYGGLFRTISNLDEAGIKYAGTGKDLAAARRPAYVETAKGRVGFLAAASTFGSMGRAGPARGDLQGRPGLNPLRFEAVSGDRSMPHAGDFEGNLAAVREAARQADWVVFSLHCHEKLADDNARPAEFIETFAHACIDAGAHMVMAHGAHELRGIELRDGRPIFYSLGNFIYQNMTFERMPAEYYEKYGLDASAGTPADAFDARQEDHPAFKGEGAWKRWASVIPSMTFEDGRLRELRLVPIDLGRERPRSQRGRPAIAEAELGGKILTDLQRLSRPYGTEIEIKDGVGFVDL